MSDKGTAAKGIKLPRPRPSVTPTRPATAAVAAAKSIWPSLLRSVSGPSVRSSAMALTKAGV